MAIKDMKEIIEETEEKLLTKKEKWLQRNEMIAEKNRLREADIIENRNRI